jgi:hypothetical protein
VTQEPGQQKARDDDLDVGVAWVSGESANPHKADVRLFLGQSLSYGCLALRVKSDGVNVADSDHRLRHDTGATGGVRAHLTASYSEDRRDHYSQQGKYCRQRGPFDTGPLGAAPLGQLIHLYAPPFCCDATTERPTLNVAVGTETIIPDFSAISRS